MTTAARPPALLAALLRSLVRGHGADDAQPSPFPGGAALVDGPTGWVLPDGRARQSLGPALAWARRAEVATVHVVVDDVDRAGALAGQATSFAPPVTVWGVVGTAMIPAVPTPAPAPAPPPDAPDLEARLLSAGLELVAGDGVLLGEVRGLEVARVSAGAGGEAVLEVGVGRFDREVGAMTYGHLPPEERLARVVEVVAEHRRPGASPHPLNQLVPERWLRSVLVSEPGLVGAADLRAVPSARDRGNLLEVGRATAVGTDQRGHPLVVVCSTGVDLDLVPGAAQDRALHAPEARLLLVVPGQDALPVTSALAACLTAPAEVVPVDGEWRIPWSS